jgi:hypothetical protein
MMFSVETMRCGAEQGSAQFHAGTLATKIYRLNQAPIGSQSLLCWPDESNATERGTLTAA